MRKAGAGARIGIRASESGIDAHSPGKLCVSAFSAFSIGEPEPVSQNRRAGIDVGAVLGHSAASGTALARI